MNDLDQSLRGLRRSSAVFTFVASIVIFVVLVSGIYTNVRVLQLTSDLRAVQHRAAEQTVAARFASCRQFNVQQKRNRAAFKDTAELLVAQVAHPTAEQTAAITIYRAAVKLKAAIDFPDRDCSAAGIAIYLNLEGK